MWKWSWEDTTQDSSTQEVDSSTEELGSSDGDSQSDLTNSMPVHVHSITFKCIGTTKDDKPQKILAIASEKLYKGEAVPVRLQPEPNNPKDAKAIAFECKIESNWNRIGYVVSEALTSVHHAIDSKCITEVKFKWIKFITHWSRSTPGWYCGISISKTGDWPIEVIRCKSSL